MRASPTCLKSPRLCASARDFYLPLGGDADFFRTQSHRDAEVGAQQTALKDFNCKVGNPPFAIKFKGKISPEVWGIKWLPVGFRVSRACNRI